MEKSTPRELILKSLKEKSSLKQDVYGNTLKAFTAFKKESKQMIAELAKSFGSVDKRVILEYQDKGEFEFVLKIAGDLLICSMHTNVFDFDKSHPLWKSSYIKDDSSRSFCGMINIYNFLSDSYKYNRINDLGYLIGRVFVNKENHYFVEGKRQLGFLYNDFVHSVFDEYAIRAVLESTIIYCINFDLFAPPFDAFKEISVLDMQSASENMQVKTGKRLGFRFQADTDSVE